MVAKSIFRLAIFSKHNLCDLHIYMLRKLVLLLIAIFYNPYKAYAIWMPDIIILKIDNWSSIA